VRISFALLAFALTGCGSRAPLADEPWTRAQGALPVGCALGVSGPTIDPGDALVHARADALANLAAGAPGARVRLESTQVVRAGPEARYRSVMRQHLKGRLVGARIVRAWTDREGQGPATIAPAVYAIACAADAAGRFPPWPGFDAVTDDASRPCAWGFAGPTIVSDQEQQAFADARRRLALLLAADIESILVDFDLSDVHAWSRVATPDEVQAQVDASATLDGSVRDEGGTGPLGIANVVYARACLP